VFWLFLSAQGCRAVCARQNVIDACAKRDLGFVIARLSANVLKADRQLDGLIKRLSDYKTGKHPPKEYSVFAAFATGWAAAAARQAWDSTPVLQLQRDGIRCHGASVTEISLDIGHARRRPRERRLAVAGDWRIEVLGRGRIGAGGGFARAWLVIRSGAGFDCGGGGWLGDVSGSV